MIALTKPKALVNLAKNWSHRDSTVVDNGEYAELMSIAVSPNAQGPICFNYSFSLGKDMCFKEAGIASELIAILLIEDF